MAQKLSSFVLGLIGKLSEQLCFIICLGLLIVMGVTRVAVILVKGEYKRLDFIRQLFLSFSVLFFQFLHMIVVNGILEYFLINSCISLFFFTITLCLPVRKKRLKKEEKELASYLDKQLRFQNLSSTLRETEENEYKIIKERPIETVEVQPFHKKSLEVPIDYSHVKNVIERLNYFPLSVNDKRQVRDLEGFLVEAESGELSPILKSKINDGLGALLKIMSKYGA